MAEIVGIVASLAAIIQLVEYGEKLSRQLYKFSNHTKFKAEEVQDCADRTRLFSKTVGVARFALDRHCEEHKESPVIEYISSSHILVSLNKTCDSVKRRLYRATRQVKDLLSGSSGLITFIRWWYQKDAIMVLFPEMESYKTTLMLLMYSAQMEALTKMIKNLPPGSYEEIKKLKQERERLRQDIKGDLETLQRLRAQEYKRSNHQTSGRHPSDFETDMDIKIEAVVILGISMLKTGAAPTSPHSSPSSSEVSVETTANHDPSVNSASSTEEISIESRTTRNAASASERPVRQPTQLNTPTASRDTFPPSQISSKIREVFRVDISRLTEYTSVYIGRNASQVDAVIIKDLDINIISPEEVRKRRLKIIPLHGDRNVWVAFGDSRPVRSIGKVSFLWRGSADEKYRRIPELDCYVVEHCRQPLILGKPYVRVTARRD